MQPEAEEAERVRRLTRQRNAFAVLAAFAVAAIGFAVPHRAASHRERKALNAELVGLQAAIVRNQQDTRVAEKMILEVQREMGKRQAP